MIYLFRCPGCEHEFEAKVPLGETETDCPQCGDNARKQFVPNANIGTKAWADFANYTRHDLDAPYVRKYWPGKRIA